MNLKKNDLKEFEITGMTTEGSGVGRADNTAVFVNNSAIGDVLSVRIIKTSKNYAIGKIEEIIKPSKNRVEPDCKCFAQCGGCSYRHMTYEAEKEVKQMRVEDALKRIGGFTKVKVEPIIGAKNRSRYRNKAQLPIGEDKDGNVLTGFYAYHSHRIVPCVDCKLQPRVFADVTRVFLEWTKKFNPQPYNEVSGKGVLRHLYIRHAQDTKEIMVCIVVNANGLYGEDVLTQMLKDEIPEFRTLVINVNREKSNVILGKKCRTVYGDGYITEKLCGMEFRISPLSFFQVNKEQTEILYSIAKDYANLKENEILLDLYCGTGTIGLSMAKNAKKLIGVEVVSDAVENARANAKNNGFSNAEFICADAALAAEKLKAEDVKPDVIVIDPPRKGCSKELLDIIVDFNAKRIVYISCDPATLARDVKTLSEKGFLLEKITPVDLFPHTPHVETVCLLSRNK